MASKSTELQLEKVTDYMGFEAFCCDLMIRSGYSNLEPLGGHKDKGRDAINTNPENGRTTLFFFTARVDWEKKLNEDLAKVKAHAHTCDAIVYATNRNISATDRDRIIKTTKAKYGWDLQIYSLKRIATLADKFPEVKKLHPGIFFIDAQAEQSTQAPLINTAAYADNVLALNEAWQEKYTPLITKYLEFELFAVNLNEKQRQLPILQIPEVVPIAVLLGESGIGKTTTLRKLLSDANRKLKEDDGNRIPIYIELRNWSDTVPLRSLVQSAFTRISATEESVENILTQGRCLLLIDGLNELPLNKEQRSKAQRDIRNFYSRYSKNTMLFTCRTVDFDPGLVDVLKSQHPPNFEVQRLSRPQVTLYIRRVLDKEPTKARSLIEALDISNDTKWYSERSFIHLMRIPMYLQMTISEYVRSGSIPQNKGTMLRSFVTHLIYRDKENEKLDMSLDVRENLLSQIALSGLEAGHYMSLPKSYLESAISQIIQALRAVSAIGQDIVAADVLSEVLSANFLTVKRYSQEEVVSLYWDRADWLHQIIFDYFLAREQIRILISPGTEKAADLLNLMSIAPTRFDQPSQMALGLLGVDEGKALYKKIVMASTELAKWVLSGVSEEDAEAFVVSTIEELTREYKWDREKVFSLSFFIPSASVVKALAKVFKTNANVEEKIILSNIVCAIAIRYKGTYAAKSALNTCEAWVVSSIDEVSFYAAKGLWGRDRGKASITFKRLLETSSPRVRQMIEELTGKWGIS